LSRGLGDVYKRQVKDIEEKGRLIRVIVEGQGAYI
jgi:hypothetical protein